MATDSPQERGAALPTYGPDEVADLEHVALAADLDSAVAGAVRFDEYAQVLYATDGSIYGARPAGVVVPEDEADVVAAVRVAADHDAPVLPRGAGSSLAGQSVGPGCVVLDLSKHLTDVLDVDPDAKRVTVQPGVVQDDLGEALDADAGGERVAYHGHCYQKALTRDHHAAAVLDRAGYEVATLDSTCCGMAGSFGYEAEHHDLSMAIGERLFSQIDAAGADPVVPGASCRTQLADRPGGDGERPPRPVEKLADALR